MNEFFQTSKDIPWQDLGNGVARQLFGYNGQLMMVRVKFEKGAIGAVHQHPHVQASYVESGQFELTIGDQVKVLKQGDGYFVPPDVAHGCVCLEKGVLIDSFTPVRSDFLV
ncbi:cupin domain-containing protein [Niabella insulamsoli]|uniref:cupin domain-containing protein n=1 Tax=Niabella insulamsoli TaxID=3144874 RepID=UPI0031FC23EC